MVAFQRVVPAVMVLALAACASKSVGTAAMQAAPGPSRWIGSFKQTQMPSATMTPAQNNRGYGTVTLTPTSTTPARLRVELSIYAPVAPGAQIGWGVFNGTCGSAAPIVGGETEYPTIEIGVNGNGSVRTELAVMLPSPGSYHVNVYWTPRARELTDVMMCAPLNFTGQGG